MLGNRIFREAAALATDAYSDSTSSAVARGWRPLTESDLGSVDTFDGGIQKSTVGTEWGEKFKTAAHAYIGEFGNQTTVALAFRGTDQGVPELLYEIAHWDDYYDEHQDLISAVAQYVGEGLRAGTIDNLIITGHSLGAMLAEETAARGLPDALVRTHTYVVSFGSPGSVTEAPTDVHQYNVVHTDDPVTRLGDYSDHIPNWLERLLPDSFEDALEDLHREGTDIDVRRPEGSSLDIHDADDLFELFFEGSDWTDDDVVVEHDLGLYRSTAATLDALFQGVAGLRGIDHARTQPFAPVDIDILAHAKADVAATARLSIDHDPSHGVALLTDQKALFYVPDEGFAGTDHLSYRIGLPGSLAVGAEMAIRVAGASLPVIDGTSAADVLIGTSAAETILGRAGADRIAGGLGDDRIRGGAGDDVAYGGGGNDNVAGSTGADCLFGRTGDDLLSGGDGRDVLTGGAGRDILRGGAGDDRLWGGADADLFVLDSAAGRDRIGDFSLADGDQAVIAIRGLLRGDGSLNGDRIELVDHATSQTLRADLDGNGTFETALADIIGTGLTPQTLLANAITDAIA